MVPTAIGEKSDRRAPPEELRAEFTQEGLARHDRNQQRRHLIGLVLLLVALILPIFAVNEGKERAGWEGWGSDATSEIENVESRNLYATLELLGSLFGMFTGFALILRFYALGNRFHLLIGLGFFVTGVQDFIYGVFFFPSLFRADEPFAVELVPLTFAAGRFLMGLTLILALVLPAWVRPASSARRETVRGAIIILLIVTIAAALLQLPVPTRLISSPRALQPIDFVALVTLATAFVGYLARYHRTGEMLDWWITASLSINVVGQLLMVLSPRPFDLYFFSAHFYKAFGYMIPLVGFFLYQIMVVLEYDRNRKDLITAREAALAAARVKTEFLANMSHEIRTPMNGVLGMTQRTLQTKLSAEQREQLLAVYDSASSLLTLLDDILDFSKMEAGKFAIDSMDFNLRDCVTSSVRALQTTAQDKGLELRLSLAPELAEHVKGDPRRLRQVLVNLVGNAIKFTPRGWVEVRVQPAKGLGSSAIRFEVEDTGIGIEPSKQRVIFDAFSQADGSTTRRFGGTGLGLAISSELVRMMGGKLSVTSEPHRGSVFRFDLSFDPAGTGGVGALALDDTFAPVPKTSRPSTILLADDNEINRRLTRSVLEEMGHQVKVAADGLEVVRLCESNGIDVILMDLQMPELSGIEATIRIREQERATGRRIPIIALTAHAMSEDRQRCLEAGMDDYLSKPVRDADLFATIETMLDRSKALDRPIPLVDQERLWGQVRHDRSILMELVELFDEQSKSLVDRMRLACEHGDRADLARAAHQLAGSAANFHVRELVQKLRDLERRAATFDENDLCKQVEEIARMAELARAELAVIAREAHAPGSTV